MYINMNCVYDDLVINVLVCVGRSNATPLIKCPPFNNKGSDIPSG